MFPFKTTDYRRCVAGMATVFQRPFDSILHAFLFGSKSARQWREPSRNVVVKKKFAAWNVQYRYMSILLKLNDSDSVIAKNRFDPIT
jgi:hypothetical protein